NYERQLRDIFAVQDEIALAIVEQLRLRLPADLRDTSTRKPLLEAYDLYLKGRFFWNRRTEEGLRRSVDFFTQSIAKDSTFALAHAALADAYNVLGTYSFMAPQEALPRARAAAEQARTLDSTLAEAHAALGFALFWHERDWSGAEHELRRAIALNASYATAHHWYSLLLSDLGRHDEAIGEMRTALRLDPLSPIISTILGTRYLFAGQLTEALGQLERTREMHPSYPLMLFWLGQTQQYLGNSAAALAAARAAVRSDTTNAMMHLGLARIYAALGRNEEARHILDDVARRFAGRFSPVHVAWVHAALGDRTKGAERLEGAYLTRDGWLNNLAVDPALKPLLAEPRVRQLLQRLQLVRG
ncbi:MAG: tetratricopeptide repeat protein, partial [Gemmatimonadaceae bacterium]